MKIKLTEHQEQKKVCQYLDLLKVPYFSIPNGFWSTLTGARKFAYINKFKSEGMKKGVPDLFIPVAYHGFNGLFIEMKTKTGVMSLEQKEWFKTLEKQGYKCICCKGSEMAIEEINNYMGK